VRSKTDLIRCILLARSEAARIAAEKALVGDQIVDDIERIDGYDKLISSLQNTAKANRLAPLLIGCASLAVASLLWAIRIPSVTVHASIEADSVSFQLAKQWESSDLWQLGSGPLRLDGLADISLPPEFAPDNKLQERAWLDVEQARVVLSNMEFATLSNLTVLQAPSSTIYMFGTGAPIRGQAHVKGAASILTGDNSSSHRTLSKSINFEVPATFRFYSEGIGGTPAQLRFSLKDKIVLRDISVQSLSFSREESDSSESPTFVSGISSGTITIGQTSEKIILNEADRLHFGPLVGTITEMEIGPKLIRLSFEGRSQAISMGTAGFEQNLVPTLLSYLYHQERLSFLWGSIVFLWSILWSARQLLFK
jgi:hypothetical protein